MPALSALVTCGPAYEPIDAVRRITNHSTGELGAMLCDALALRGFEVTCLRGEMATHPAPKSARVLEFSTNTSLLELLKNTDAPSAIFHAAALCDFTLASERYSPGKIRSDTPELHLVLHPAEKVLPRLRPMFPSALIVGWKYEVDGSREDAIARGRRQISLNGTDACVVNGPAYGDGLGVLEQAAISHHDTRQGLCDFLAEWSAARLRQGS